MRKHIKQSGANMHKKFILFSLLILLFTFSENSISISSDNNTKNLNQNNQTANNGETNNTSKDPYKFPQFYKGIYLNVYSARNMERLSFFVEKAKSTKLNTLVLDVQTGKNNDCAVSSEIVSYCIKNGLHPVARIVVFTDGLSKYPVSEDVINNRINIAELACKNGFKEIQFDYIRFNDYRVSKRLSFAEKYEFIAGFLNNARTRLKKYNAKIAADIFGRIPLNQDDAIGQKMEVFDKVVDIICPMAYPSHYTWSNKMMADPYYTVYVTSKSARERAKNADIVTYIQAFQMKVSKSNLTFDKYIEEQLRAIYDSGVKGYILWNASQNYDVPFKVLSRYNKSLQEAVNTNNKNKSS